MVIMHMDASLLLCVVLVLLDGPVQGQTPCDSEEENSIQLNTSGVFATGQGAGRVEICHCTTDSSCFWQTVSTGSLTVPFSWKNSIVVCRELEYFDVQSPILQNTVLDANHADESVSIYQTTFVCDGTESTLAECDSGVDTSSLTHKSDAYVTCQTSVINGKVRLTGSVAPDEGVVEYYTTEQNLSWSTICPDFWSDVEANLFCVSIGYNRGTAKKFPRSLFANSDANIQSDHAVGAIRCSHDQTVIGRCAVTLSENCADFTNLAGAVCVPETERRTGSVKTFLVNGFDFYSRVEVLYGGRWGTVCNTAWDLESGQVACRELGNTPSLSQVGPVSSVAVSSRPIWILGYNCEGTESNLRSCQRPLYPIGYLISGCSHSADAGVYCEKAPEPPKQLSGGAIAGIVLAALTFVGTIVFIIVLEDKRKKGELQPWYRAKKAMFLRWYHRRREQCRKCCCCCCRRRRRVQNNRQRNNNQQSSPQQATTQPAVLVAQSPPATVPLQPVPPPQPQPPVLPSAPQSNLTPSAPPSYDDALQQQHVKPPPDYSPGTEKRLPYPESSEYNPAFPPQKPY